MPGLNIFISSTKCDKNIHTKFKQTSKKMLHDPSYSNMSIIYEDPIIIGFTAYNSYPKEVFKTEQFVILLEGMIYNKNSTDIKTWLFKLASKLMKGDISIKYLKEFLTESDGEFIIVVYDKVGKKIFIMNDLMGRLPVYYHKKNDSLLVSREIKFFIPFLHSVEFNKTALMEYLLYGFPFDEKTLIKNIFRVKPATFLEFDTKNGTFSKKTICSINFDKTENETTKSDEIEELKKLFQEGLKNRVKKIDNRKQIISLSGGLDSRATLAGLSSINVKPEAITNIFNNSGEENLAKEVAEEFDIKITALKPKQSMTIQEYKEITHLKDGLNPTTLAKDLDILHKISKSYGNNIVMYTGLYGGESLRYLHLNKGLKSTENLTKFLVNTNEGYKYSTENVCRMLNITEEKIEKHVHNHLMNFEEKNVYNKYIQFRFEKDYRWAGEGEDRKRFFFWTITPFYSIPFFNYARSIDEKKKDLLFFRNFIYSLDPRSCNVLYYNTKANLNNMWKLNLFRLEEKMVRNPKIRRFAKSILSTKSKISLKNKKTNKEDNEEIKRIRKILITLLRNSKIIDTYFSSHNTENIIIKEKNLAGLHRLLTIFLYMNSFESQKPKI